jgi:tRNA1Val (adenine37-N6)-methyltransferase
MSNTYFQFKQFRIEQDRCAMKVGTDGVLLGSWASVNETNSILDIGTGTGLIALMLAQRSNATINAIEINKEAFNQSYENISNSKWNSRIKVHNCSFQDFYKTQINKFDLIVSNPPYFKNSLKPKENDRVQARHNIDLSSDELLLGVKKLLNENGCFCIILPALENDSFILEAEQYNLFCSKIVYVKPTLNKDTKRIMLEFVFGKVNRIEDSFAIETDKRHCYTEEYKNLTKDFYL